MKVAFTFFRVALKDKTEFSQDLVFHLLNYILYIVITAFMWTSVTSTFGNIGGWTSFNFVMLTCFAGLYRALNDFFAGAWNLKNHILEGNLDKYLCRPINVLKAEVYEGFEPISLFEGLVTVTVTTIIGCCVLKPENISFIKNIVPAIIIFACGTFSILSMKTIVSLLTIWLGDVSVFNSILFFEDLQFDRYPTIFLTKGFSLVLNWIVPLGLIATFPAYVLTFDLELQKIVGLTLGAMGIALLWGIILSVVYNLGLKHYESFGG